MRELFIATELTAAYHRYCVIMWKNNLPPMPRQAFVAVYHGDV